jgi:hypothetical protein
LLVAVGGGDAVSNLPGESGSIKTKHRDDAMEFSNADYAKTDVTHTSYNKAKFSHEDETNSDSLTD